MLIAVVCAIAAGACFASAGVLQQHMASTRPPEDELSPRLLAGLAREPLWLAGIGLAFLAFVLESVALAFGPLVLVQPLIVTELLAALPISMRLRGMRMGRREWLGALAVTFGLCVGLVSASPRAGVAAPPLDAWMPALAGASALAGLAVVAGRHVCGPARSSLYAAAAGIVLATQAGLLKSVIALFQRGLVPAFSSWQLWGMVAASVIGLLLVQSAYQAGPLAASMPVIDAVNTAVAIILGAVLFREQIRTGLWLLGFVAGLIPLFSGIVLLDTSTRVRRLQRAELTERDYRIPAEPSHVAAGHLAGSAGSPCR
ncbi:MAG TPA: DMT family transporter [Streptosporangiaceae bacterium]|nr:DMT family transporter [Streptosporangiaceae bacterium]